MAIEIYNPTMEEEEYEICIMGGDLYGENQMRIGGGRVGVYKLMFAPKGLYEGRGSIAFINERLGQKPYELKLQSKESPPVKIPQLKCEIGCVKFFELKLPEHYKLDAAPHSTISNSRYTL